MVKYYPSITSELGDWAMSQAVFFVSSAPLHGKHVNISPKGLPSTTFTIFHPNSCAYVDATGSGNETISHIYENGRVTIMFCSFNASPRIMRFFCRGKVIEADQPTFNPLIDRIGQKIEGARAIILLDVFKVQTSCGFGVPLLALKETDGDGDEKWKPYLQDRKTMGHWASKQIEKGELEDYQRDWNADSLDGLPGLRAARRRKGERLWLGDVWAWFGRWRDTVEVLGAVLLGVLVTLVVVGLVADDVPAYKAGLVRSVSNLGEVEQWNHLKALRFSP